MYKKFNETRAETIFVDEWVEMIWSSSVKDYYQDLGYEYTGHRDRFWVHIDDLAPTSGKYINVQCPVCKEERSARRNQVSYSGHTICNKCSKTLDLTNEKFGRWTPLYPYKSINGALYWMCECECGTVKLVQGGSLIKGNTTSCGCYRHEFLCSRTGEKSPVWVGPIVLRCEQCGAEYEAEDSWDAKKRRFCSPRCANQWRGENLVGPAHPRWNPDITAEERLIRRSYPEYAKYIKAVMKRDNYQCQVCGSVDTELEVHHLYSYAHYPEYAIDVDYGVVICKSEHKDFHSWMGGNSVECIPADFDRWLYENL